MTTTNPKIYLTRAGGNGQDENDAPDNGLAILDFRRCSSLARTTYMLRSTGKSPLRRVWMLVKETVEE